MNTAATVRLANLDTRNRKIREAFYQRYTRVSRERKPDRELVLAQRAEEYCLSVATVEGILWTRGK